MTKAEREALLGPIKQRLSRYEGLAHEVAHSRTDIPVLIALVEQQGMELDTVLSALKELRDWYKSEYQSNQWIDARVDAAIAACGTGVSAPQKAEE